MYFYSSSEEIEVDTAFIKLSISSLQIMPSGKSFIGHILRVTSIEDGEATQEGSRVYVCIFVEQWSELHWNHDIQWQVQVVQVVYMCKVPKVQFL